jgi:hypothetical protein
MSLMQIQKTLWNMYLSLILFYMHNEKTAPIIDGIEAFPN